MDVSSPERSIEAEKIIESVDDGDPYEDGFNQKIDELSDINLSHSDFLKVDADQQINQENTIKIKVKNNHTFNAKSAHMVDINKQDQKHEINETQDISTAIDKDVIELPQQEITPNDKATFQNSKYRTVETTKDLILYRVYGDKTAKEGRFLTTHCPTDRLETKLESALLAEWGNSRKYYCEVYVPKGTILNIGKVEKQQTVSKHILEGGGDQVLVSDEFAADSRHYGREHKLGSNSNYLKFEKIAHEIEEDN